MIYYSEKKNTTILALQFQFLFFKSLLRAFLLEEIDVTGNGLDHLTLLFLNTGVFKLYIFKVYILNHQLKVEGWH